MRALKLNILEIFKFYYRSLFIVYTGNRLQGTISQVIQNLIAERGNLLFCREKYWNMRRWKVIQDDLNLFSLS